MDLKVSDIGEKRIVKYILSKCKSIIPDDCAITSLNNDINLVSTTDMLIQSSHFPDFMNYYDMGFKSVTVNVSDIASMGAKPLGYLSSIALFSDLDWECFKQLFQGILDACDYYDIPLIGGDINQASEIIISGTALGLSESVLRKNIYNKGDLIAITGDLGYQGLNFYKKIYNQPFAKIREGLILNDNGITAATDITDGLSSELYEMFDGENGFLIYEDEFNITDEFKKEAKSLNIDYLDLILNFGEDFELLFIFPKSKKILLEKLMDFKVIGEVIGDSCIEIVLSNGKREKIVNKGYEHF